MGGCFPCFGSSDEEKKVKNGVKGGEEGRKDARKEGSVSVSKVSLGNFIFPLFDCFLVLKLHAFCENSCLRMIFMVLGFSTISLLIVVLSWCG